MITHTPGPWHQAGHLIVASDGTSICEPTFNRKVSNVRLIAAAPDLLAALQWCVDNDGECLGDHVKQRMAAYAAIAKATGGA